MGRLGTKREFPAWSLPSPEVFLASWLAGLLFAGHKLNSFQLAN